MPYLNGKLVSADEIDPAKHRYVGMFRITFPEDGGGGYVACSCGEVLQSARAVRDHYQLGHFDEPQYADIDND